MFLAASTQCRAVIRYVHGRSLGLFFYRENHGCAAVSICATIFDTQKAHAFFTGTRRKGRGGVRFRVTAMARELIRSPLFLASVWASRKERADATLVVPYAQASPKRVYGEIRWPARSENSVGLASAKLRLPAGSMSAAPRYAAFVRRLRLTRGATESAFQ